MTRGESGSGFDAYTGLASAEVSSEHEVRKFSKTPESAFFDILTPEENQQLDIQLDRHGITMPSLKIINPEILNAKIAEWKAADNDNRKRIAAEIADEYDKA